MNKYELQMTSFCLQNLYLALETGIQLTESGYSKEFQCFSLLPVLKSLSRFERIGKRRQMTLYSSKSG